jgi:predicted permease
MGAGIMIQSLLALRQSHTGFDLNNVLTMEVSLVATRYRTAEQRTAFYDAALERIRALPGVETAATIDDLPLLDGSSQTLALEGSAAPAQADPVAVQVRQITPGYLRAMRIPVLRGRDVADGDGDVLLVSREAAKLYWANDDPIGRRAALPAISRTMFREVVGIVGDVKQRDLADNFTPTVYYYSRNRSWSVATFVVRTSVPPATLAQPATAAIHAIDPQQPVQNVQTMERVRDDRLSSERLSALLLSVFAGIALLLASVGIYSVVSYIVRGRSREIGIRAALGARTSDVLSLVIVEGMTPTLIGIAVGTIAAFASARILERLIFGVSASDPTTLIVVSLTLATVALAACLVPAWRAAQLDPLKVLREP